jgi:hypothetical protein
MMGVFFRFLFAPSVKGLVKGRVKGGVNPLLGSLEALQPGIASGPSGLRGRVSFLDGTEHAAGIDHAVGRPGEDVIPLQFLEALFRFLDGATAIPRDLGDRRGRPLGVADEITLLVGYPHAAKHVDPEAMGREGDAA